jgi:hypothetical protein
MQKPFKEHVDDAWKGLLLQKWNSEPSGFHFLCLELRVKGDNFFFLRLSLGFVTLLLGLEVDYPRIDRLCGLVIRVSGYITEMHFASCEVRTEFIYVM